MMNLSFICVLFCILAFGLCEDNEEKDVCTDKSSCLELEFQNWFQKLKDKKTVLSCDNDLGEVKATGEPIFTVTTNCNEDGAIWQYKYSGAKGKS